MSRQMLIFAEWLFWALLALILWMQTGTFSEGITEYKFGADGWPKMVIIGLFIGATGQAAFKYITPSEASETPKKTPPKDAMSGSKRLQQIAIFGLPLVYLFAMHRIGFFVASPLFIAAYLYVLEVRKWRHIISVTVITVALLFYIFVRLFYVALPVGAWEFFYMLNNEIIILIRWGL